MKKNNIFKWIICCIFTQFLSPIVFAATTSQQWRDILNQLRNEWRTDQEIKIMMEDLWLDTSGYFWNNKSTSTNTTTRNTTVNYNNQNTTQQWRDILNQLRNEWRTDQEIKIMMEDLWLDTSGYFSNSNNKSSNTESVYTSRSCKVYNIEYIDNLWVYTSSNLKKQEYFINVDYFKRYLDSKNPQKSGCPVNGWYITKFYEDQSNSIDRYVAPNWKVYFITNQNWSYTSNEISKSKSFWTINELKNYIRDRNPLIYMWKYSNQSNSTNKSSNNIDDTISKMRNNVFN